MAKSKNELIFLPLGGSGEIGMNLNLFGFGPEHDRKWIIVDIGVTFGDLSTPGVEIIMPDTLFIEERKDNLLGIVLTHAHEDHMGALARLWPRLRCPVYATPFTMYLVKDRLAEAGLLKEVPLHEMPLKSRFKLGPFYLEYVTITHSIPEPNGLAVRTSKGTVFHTGDWKIDEDPQIGEQIDVEAITRLKEENVLAMICDSTNALSPGRAGSEGDVRKELFKLVGEYEGRGVAVASFASNVARLESIMLAAKAHDRSVCLVGRSMRRMVGAAKSVGLLTEVGAFVEEERASRMPSGNVLYLCTGSQGESRAALSKIANGERRNVKFHKGDVVIFSSKIIPGNEKSIFKLQNALAEDGVEIITEKMRPIHVSGHPYQDELKQMYEWVKPHLSIPVHGERRHLMKHAELAKKWGVKHSVDPKNGEMFSLSEAGIEIVDIVPSGRLYEDSGIIVSAGDPGIKLRRKMAYAGHISVSLVYNKKGKILSGPEPRISGFPEGVNGEYMDDLLDLVAEVAEETFYKIPSKARTNEDLVEERIRSKVKRAVNSKTDKRAVVEITAHLM
ncbi:MAG: ribonuclease J [Hellea sp.]|nr:ribonuclease J [Hellea sp.]